MKCTPLQTVYRYGDIEGESLLFPLEDAWYVVRDSTFTWLVKSPRAMPFDGMSIPLGFRNLLTPFRHRGRPGARLHDSGYKGIARVWLFDPRHPLVWIPQHHMSRWWWDSAFAACNRATGLWRPLRGLVYWAVRAFGGPAWKREQQRYAVLWRERRREISEKLDIAIPVVDSYIPEFIKTRALEV